MGVARLLQRYRMTFVGDKGEWTWNIVMVPPPVQVRFEPRQ
eukprot:NODE_5615_length_373_cov_369.453704_g4518_i0.p1 GENE.NODE_5615_length_373_cov_369.453704_g4518_i0~~NODE_5615_length_373_cov_369.453704_g4518_i0.p1  ORF type:complete len:50 (-),score=34.56 NODE_5615_length_373_cov_369.453704_g4518_i0:223-345(-)